MTVISVPFKNVGVDVITYGGRYRIGRAQNFEVSANLPNTPVQELGSDRLVGRNFDIPEVSVTLSTMDVGPRNLFAIANRDWASASLGTSITLNDLTYVCLAQSFKDQTTNDIARTLFVPGAKVDSLSMTYNVNGDATEDVTFVASDYRWLRYDAAVYSGQVNASSQLTFSPSARALKGGGYILSAFTQNGWLPPEAIVSSTATTVTFDPAYVPANTQVLIVYHADLSNQWQYTYQYPNVAPGYTPPPDQPVGIRGWGVEVYLVRNLGSPEARRVLRAQSCSIQAQMNSQRIQELGTDRTIGYMDTIPDVTGTIEIMYHNNALYRWLSGDTDATEDDDFTLNELGNGNWGLLVQLWRRDVVRSTSTNPEKTIWIPRLEITQKTNRAQVGQDQMQTFNFASATNELIVYKGRHPGFII